MPKNLNTTLLTGVETVTNDEAFTWARRLAHEEGILVGISSGANVAAAVRVASLPENRGKVIVTFAQLRRAVSVNAAVRWFGQRTIDAKQCRRRPGFVAGPAIRA